MAAWVHSTDDLPLAALLASHGIQIEPDTPATAQALGLRVQETHSVLVKQVLRGGLAEQAGLMAGDEWYGIEVPQANAVQHWRLSKLEELNMYVPHGCQQVTALVARDRQLMRLALTLPTANAPIANYQLTITDESALKRWLVG